MPELRKDPIMGRWVIIATERGKRPITPRRESMDSADTPCPFCEGSEQETPEEILSYREKNSTADSPGWRVRVVPNKFPALQLTGELQKRGDGIYDRMNGLGAHEVIIECPNHETSIAQLSKENVREVLRVYRDRLVALKKDPRFVYGMVFKNVGATAGASLEHTHSQLIVTPIVPINVWEEMSGAMEFFNFRGRCVFCDMIHEETGHGKRVVMETENFLCLEPYASRFPFETWILPRNHNSHYENIQHNEVEELGVVLKTMLLKLEKALDNPAYNYIIHTSPFDVPFLPHYHWHIEIIPRLTRVAGFEWGTGFYINPVPPEESADILRETQVDVNAQIRTA